MDDIGNVREFLKVGGGAESCAIVGGHAVAYDFRRPAGSLAATNLDFEAKHNLRWLFLRGPYRRVWPINTLNPSRMENIMPWLDAFHTRIFGPMKNSGHVRSLDAQAANLNSLNTGTQFTLREGENWLKFWIPAAD